MIHGTVIRLLLALTILASPILRPPGAMLVMSGDTITYEICTGGEVDTIRVTPDGETPREVDLGCDFFAAQIGALLQDAPRVAPAATLAIRIAAVEGAHVFMGQTTRASNAPRAPPFG